MHGKIPGLLYLMLITITICAFSKLNAQQFEQKSCRINNELTVKEIEPGFYLAIHNFLGPANSLIIKYKNGQLLLIDTPFTDDATKELVDWVLKDDTSNVKITAVNTHFHMDNLGGNGYLYKKNAVIYGSDLTVSLLNERGLGNGIPEMLKAPGREKQLDYYTKNKLYPPNNIFKLGEEKHFVVGTDSISIYFPGAGHAPDNITVYFHNRKILFGGCLVKSLGSKNLGNVGDAVVNEWPESLKKLREKYKEAKLVIPGHGDEGSLELIDHSLKLFL